ncbi:hypothetical protein [Verrucomicrobium sp. 3C]|uniref:hypothetical protein n=1 Tax=Verrucomicrobium sp. 3C TaxID=1134055 RepID=UPI00037626E0|nr:hypothetical protein [Verrucomicrobium sp. 3C]
MSFPPLRTSWPVLAALAVLWTGASAAFAQSSDAGDSEPEGLLGQVHTRLQKMKQKRSEKNKSIHYDPAVLRPGVSRQKIHATFGPPNATQNEGTEREEVYAFFPDGSKYQQSDISAADIARAVFTSGASLAVRAAQKHVHKSQLTLYRVSYDKEGIARSVKLVPSALGAKAPSGSAHAP